MEKRKIMTPEVALSEYEIERNKPMPSLNHSIIQSNLIMELAVYRQKYRIVSELSLDLSEWPSVPDISILPKIDIDLRHDVIAVKEAPLVAIEIISPSQSLNELVNKAEKYFEHGVQSCWLVIPSLGNIYVFSTPDVYQIFRKNEILTDPSVDITLPLDQVFV